MPFPFRASVRAACMDLLDGYKGSTSIKLDRYTGRPRQIFPPHAFVDRITERPVQTGPTLRQRYVRAEVVVLHGLFDSAEAVAQADAFVDGFSDYLQDHFHQAGEQTLIEAIEINDEPSFVPDWIPPGEQRTYYGTRITLEGFAET